MSTASDFVTLATGVGFAEGPVATQDGNVVFTSVTHHCLYRIADGGAVVLAMTGGGPNGAAEGPDGRLYVAQNGGWGLGMQPDPDGGALGMAGGVQVVEPDGQVEWLTLAPVAPNDLCFGPDGLLYVTDPTRPRDDDSRIWRCDPRTGESELLLSVPWYANGIGFGREDDALYVVCTTYGQLLRYSIDAGRLRTPEAVVRMAYNRPDGFLFDADGNVTIASFAPGGDGDVQTWSLEGELLDVLRPVQAAFYSNVVLTPDRRLIVTVGDAERVIACDGWAAEPLDLHPFRR